MHIKPSRRALAATVAGVVLLGIAGTAAWGGGSLRFGLRPGGELGARTSYSSAPTNPTLPPPPLSTLAPAARDRVLEAYLRFWQVAQTVDRRPPEQWESTLQSVTGQPLLDQLLDGLRAQRARGIRQYGTVAPHAAVVELIAGRATVVDCQDASQSGEVHRDTGTIEKVGSARTAVAAVLRRDQRGTWRVTEARYLPDAC